jgi:hypothetical protein
MLLPLEPLLDACIPSASEAVCQDWTTPRPKSTACDAVTRTSATGRRLATATHDFVSGAAQTLDSAAAVSRPVTVDRRVSAASVVRTHSVLTVDRDRSRLCRTVASLLLWAQRSTRSARSTGSRCSDGKARRRDTDRAQMWRTGLDESEVKEV